MARSKPATRSWLARRQRLETYSVHDLLATLPSFDQVPGTDLSSVLSGAGAQSPFTGDDQPPRLDPIDRAEDLVAVITDLIEPDAWTVNGGLIASIRIHDGRLLVRAPDYIHRQLLDHRPR